MAFPTQIGMYDPLGAFFLVSLVDGGAGFNIDPASPPTPPPNPPVVSTDSITIQLKATLEWAKRYIANRDATIGNGVEPAITNANLILQTILGPPFRWRWNRVITGFYTQAGVQDYKLINWMPQQAVGQG